MMAKLISNNTSITDTISKTSDAPSFPQLRNSINYLKVSESIIFLSTYMFYSLKKFRL